MSARTRRSTYVPGRGTTTRSKSGKAKTYEGSGPAPSGTKKVTPKTAATAPTITKYPSGTVVATNYNSKRAKRRALRQAARSFDRVQRITHTGTHAPQNASQRVKPKSVKTSNKLAVKPKSSPTSKPRTYEGHKTAGTPTLKQLETSAKKGTLKVNKKGFVTTPKIRKVAKAVKQAKWVVAKSSKATQLPLETPEQQKVARKVLTVGKKMGANKKELLAAAETGLVESGFRNLHEGDADSEGWRQERTSLYPNPTNVKDAAKRFFTETKSQSGATAGELAANVQRPAEQYRGRYDEEKAPAAAILHAFTKGKPNPKAAKKLKVAKAQARKVGLAAGKKSANAPAGPSRIPSVVYIGRQAEKKFGLHVGENPAFGGVEPVHVSDSYHYRRDAKGRGEAIDVSGDPSKMLAFDHWVARKWGKGVTELFYDPGTSIKEGTEIGPIGGHEDHVHVAVAMPGEKIAGGMTVGEGGAVFVGYGGSASAAAASSTSAMKAASKGKAARVSPWQRYWGTVKKLKSLGVDVSPTAKPSSKPKTTLSELEAKYGTNG